MAFQYNDNRPITNHTHIDYPLTCGTNNSGTVTWVDFINFRNVDNFGVEPNKQSIGGTWLNVLDKLQGCFDEINDRFEQAEINYSSISIGGDTSFGDNSSIFLVSNINANWTIQNISTSDTSDGAITPNMVLTDTSDTYTKVNITNEPSFDKGTIEFTNYQNGETVTLNDKNDGIDIKAIYNRDPDSIEQIRWQGTVKARSQANFEVYATKDVHKTFYNPYYREGEWTWNVVDREDKDFNIMAFNDNEIYIQYIGNAHHATGTLICTNTNASSNIALKLEYEATEYTVTFVFNNGLDPVTINMYARTTIPLPDGPAKDGGDDTHVYVFIGWYLQPDFSGQKYDPQFNWTVNHDVTFYAKHELVDISEADIEDGSITEEKLSNELKEYIRQWQKESSLWTATITDSPLTENPSNVFFFCGGKKYITPSVALESKAETYRFFNLDDIRSHEMQNNTWVIDPESSFAIYLQDWETGSLEEAIVQISITYNPEDYDTPPMQSIDIFGESYDLQAIARGSTYFKTLKFSRDAMLSAWDPSKLGFLFISSSDYDTDLSVNLKITFRYLPTES